MSHCFVQDIVVVVPVPSINLWKRKRERKLCNSQKSVQIFVHWLTMYTFADCTCACSGCNVHTQYTHLLDLCCRFFRLSFLRLLSLYVFLLCTNATRKSEKNITKWQQTYCWWQIKWFKVNWLLLNFLSIFTTEQETKLFVLGFFFIATELVETIFRWNGKIVFRKISALFVGCHSVHNKKIFMRP